MLADGPPATEADVSVATELIIDAGGLEWAGREADAHMHKAVASLNRIDHAEPGARADLVALADYIVNRDR
jgi:geranylgeranyl pyrophosphate synthase